MNLFYQAARPPLRAVGLAALALACAGYVVGCDGDTNTTETAASSSASGSSSSSGAGGEGGSSGAGGAGGAAIANPPDWSCLGTITWPAPTAATATLTTTYKDYISNSALAGRTVKACTKADIDCAAPVDTQTTDAMGTAAITVPLDPVSGFDGFVDVSGTGVAWLDFSSQPTTGDRTLKEGLVTDSGLNALAATVNQTVDPAKGVLVLSTNECGPGKPWGVIFEVTPLDPANKVTYLKDGLPDLKATETDSYGLATVLNVPPGPITVTAKVKADGKKIASYDAFVRKGTVTAIYMPPSP